MLSSKVHDHLNVFPKVKGHKAARAEACMNDVNKQLFKDTLYHFQSRVITLCRTETERAVELLRSSDDKQSAMFGCNPETSTTVRGKITSCDAPELSPDEMNCLNCSSFLS